MLMVTLHEKRSSNPLAPFVNSATETQMHVPRFPGLPVPLSDPTGESRMTNGQPWPRISIVTPSFNQGQFIEETILSVIGQHYPNLEYIVMDGGSSDNTVEVIKKYEKHISHWQSAKDNGQSAAINDGFGRATGDIVAWLNSDDFYFPGTLHYVATQLDISRSEILLGNCFHFFQNSAQTWGSDVAAHHANSNLLLCDYIIQPSSFWTQQTWKQVGQLNEDLHFVFDWDWYIRARQASIGFKTSQKYLSAYRFHEAHKSGGGGAKRRDEIAEIYTNYSGKQYAQLFRDLYKSRDKITKFKRNINRFRLSKVTDTALNVLIPHVYQKYSKKDIDSILSMCLD